MVLVETSVVMGHAFGAGVLVAVVEVDVMRVDDLLLEVVGAYLVKAFGLAVQVRAVVAMGLALVAHVDVDAYFVTTSELRGVGVLRRLKRLGLGLIIIDECARTTASSRRTSSLRVHEGLLSWRHL